LPQSILKVSSCVAKTVQPLRIRTITTKTASKYFIVSALSLIITLYSGAKIYTCNISLVDDLQHIYAACVDGMGLPECLTSGWQEKSDRRTF
jgi:hypothetical protein